MVFIIFPHPRCQKSDGIRLEPNLEEQCEFTEKMVDVMMEEFHLQFIPILQLNLKTRVKLVVREIAKRRPDLLTDLGKQLQNVD